MKKLNHIELLIYCLVWIVVAFMPLLNPNVRTDSGILWMDIIDEWLMILPYFIVFLLHNLISIPYLLSRNRQVAYTLSLAVLFGLFLLTEPFAEPGPVGKDEPQGPPMQEQMAPGPSPSGQMMPQTPPPSLDKGALPPPEGQQNSQLSQHLRMKQPGPSAPGRIPMNFLHLLVAVLMIGANLAVHLFLKQRKEQELLNEMEQERLKHELEYLKFQINPHFFMNTLNNIHALVDIDGEKAKESIVELSKLMRFVLYDGNVEKIQLSREIEFMKNYITLMRLRFDESVDIRTDFPSETNGVEVPPLIFITFVENAFKHGFSYRSASFVHIQLSVEQNQQITFTCSNSKVPEKVTSVTPPPKQKESGIGLDNVRKRLDLIYPGRHTLTIAEDETTYRVTLIIQA